VLTVPDIGDLYTAGVRTVGSLCTGTGQLERALTLAGVDTKLAFVADPDKGATALLAHHHPDVPNLGDITKVDWTRVCSVHIFCAGYPCQGFSLAGHRLGENDERFIWPYVFAGIRDLRPRVVLLENVPGHLSLGFGRVLGDLASIGYDANWTCVRASDVGAAHRRERVFILAFPAGTDPRDVLGVPAAGAACGRGGDGAVLTPLLKTPTAQLAINGGSQHPDKRKAGGHGPTLADQVEWLLPTPMAADAERTSATMARGNPTLVGALLPTPAACRSGRQKSASAGAAIRPSLDMVHALLPTPRATDGEKGGPNQRGSSGDLTLPSAVHSDRWGTFAPAITRWEAVTGRPAPEPTEPGRTGQRLSPRFVEWLMGHEDRFVTGVPGLTRNQQLRLLGNGVVALQGAEAIRQLTEVPA
jgi:DNA (cytosine-5)-methyltransferase 1